MPAVSGKKLVVVVRESADVACSSLLKSQSGDTVLKASSRRAPRTRQGGTRMRTRPRRLLRRPTREGEE